MKNKYVVGVCDDERVAADIIASAVGSIFSRSGVPCDIVSFDAVGDLRERMKTLTFDLLLLDIEMPGESGLEFSRTLRRENNGVVIIFVSNRTELVFESLEVSPFAFVRKSNLIADISAAMERYLHAERVMADKGGVLIVKKHTGIGSYHIDEITYIDSFRNIQHIHRVKDEKAEIKSTMNELEEQLAPHHFCRVHKGYIVNLAYVADIVSDTITLRGGERIPISRGKTPEVRLKYMQYLQQNNILINR